MWYLLLLLLLYLCCWCSSMKHNNMACFCPSKSISLLMFSCAKSIYCGLSFIYLKHAWWALQAGIAHGFYKGLSVSLCILYTSLSFKVQDCGSLLHNKVSINLSVGLGSAAFQKPHTGPMCTWGICRLSASMCENLNAALDLVRRKSPETSRIPKCVNPHLTLSLF